MSATTRTRYRPGVLDLARRESYLTRLDWGLRNLPSRESRQILRDLRRDVTATAADIGMRPALSDLGTPVVLAEQYTAGIDPEGPRYGSGAIAAGATGSAIVFLLLAYAIGSGQTLAAMGGGVREVTLWGSQIILTSRADVDSLEIANVLPLLLVILAISAVSFVLFARIWRLRHRSR
ncbi:MAG: hypothetical protein ABIZ07_01170 [Dermatophilaceae bacterium]